MNKKKQVSNPKSQFPLVAFLAFLGLAVVFSCLRYEITAVNAWILKTFGGYKDIDQYMVSRQQRGLAERVQAERTSLVAAPVKKKKAKKAAKKKKVKLVDKSVNKPKTRQPVVALYKAGNPLSKPLPRAPKVRVYNGQDWDKEKTELFFGTDGKHLYIKALCYDSNPSDLETKFGDKQGGGVAYQDDSIEVFLMKDRKADIYCQYVCSASGKHKVYYCNNVAGDPRAMSSRTVPAGFVKPEITGSKNKLGYKVIMKIDLSNIGLFKVDEGDEILLQLIRNYRGVGSKERLVLQLFPNHVYQGAAYGSYNHDRRAFQPIKIKDGDKIK